MVILREIIFSLNIGVDHGGGDCGFDGEQPNIVDKVQRVTESLGSAQSVTLKATKQAERGEPHHGIR